MFQMANESNICITSDDIALASGPLVHVAGSNFLVLLLVLFVSFLQQFN